MMDYVVLGTAMLGTGLIGGVLAGLLGVGGGIVIVPVLEAVLAVLGIDPSIRMHVAVATSLATIIPTSISSSRAHYRRGSVDLGLAKRWGAFITGGAIFGALLASLVSSRVLAAIFGTVALLVAVKMMLPLDNRTISKDIPAGVMTPLIPSGIGGLSSMMGIGGGTLSVPLLTLMSKPIHAAVGTSAVFGLAISLPATAIYMVSGWGADNLPAASLGFVNVIGFMFISPTTILGAPIGVRIAHWLTGRHLSLLFGLFLLIVAIRMIFQAI